MKLIKILILVLSSISFSISYAQTSSSLSSSISVSKSESLGSSLGQSSKPVTDMNSSLQSYNQTASIFDKISPPEVKADGSLEYTYISGTAVISGKCTSSGCVSTGQVVSCGANQVALVHGDCDCAPGYEWTGGISAGQGYASCVEKKTCATGTFPVGHLPSQTACQCENNLKQTIALGAPNTCIGIVREGGNCGEDPRGDDFADNQDIGDWDRCVAAEKQAEIEALIAINQGAASSDSRMIAQSNWEQAANAEAQRIIQECNTAVNNYKTECTTLGEQGGGGQRDTSGGSKSMCQASLNSASADQSSINQKVQSCTTRYRQVQASCPSTTGVVSAQGEATATNGQAQYGNVVVVSETSEVSRSKTIPETRGLLADAASSLGSLTAQADPIVRSLDASIAGAKSCLARFDEDQDDDNTASVAPKAPESLTAPAPDYIPSEPSNTNNETELAQSKTRAGDVLNGIGAMASGLNTGGDFEQEYIAPPSFKSSSSQANQSGFNSGGSGGASLSSNKALDLGANVASGGDDLRNLTDINDTRGNNSGFRAEGNSENTGSQGASSGSNTSPQNAQLSGNQGQEPGKRRGSRRVAAQGRSLINGYKTVKAKDGGGNLSIHPSAFKKYTKKQMKQKLNEARKTYGKKVPLKFTNGEFVMDFLAMKDAKNFKKKHSSMDKFWRGENKAPVTGMDCEIKQECHSNASSNIFKIMNFRMMKTMYNVKN